MDISKYIVDGSLKIIVKPNAKKTEITGFDDSRMALKVDIKEKAEQNKANVEVVRFFSKLLKKDVKILKGLKSKEKILKIMM